MYSLSLHNDGDSLILVRKKIIFVPFIFTSTINEKENWNRNLDKYIYSFLYFLTLCWFV